MSFGSVKLTHNDGTMHHLGIDETMVAKRVILTPDPLQIPRYAAMMEQAEKVGEYREYVTYTGTMLGSPLSVMSCGFGCMPMAIAVEELHHLGVEEIIKIGCCPALQPETAVGTLLRRKRRLRCSMRTRRWLCASSREGYWLRRMRRASARWPSCSRRGRFIPCTGSTARPWG